MALFQLNEAANFLNTYCRSTCLYDPPIRALLETLESTLGEGMQ